MLCCGIVRLVVAEHFTPFSLWRDFMDVTFPLFLVNCLLKVC